MLPTECGSNARGIRYASSSQTGPSLVSGTQTGWGKCATTCSAVLPALRRNRRPGYRGKGGARLSVTDQGPGIPGEVLPHLFKRFYGGEHHAGDAGLGLGLYISRMLVEAHGGRIRADSTPGQGSTFTVLLPITP